VEKNHASPWHNVKVNETSRRQRKESEDNSYAIVLHPPAQIEPESKQRKERGERFGPGVGGVLHEHGIACEEEHKRGHRTAAGAGGFDERSCEETRGQDRHQIQRRSRELVRLELRGGDRQIMGTDEIHDRRPVCQ